MKLRLIREDDIDDLGYEDLPDDDNFEQGWEEVHTYHLPGDHQIRLMDAPDGNDTMVSISFPDGGETNTFEPDFDEGLERVWPLAAQELINGFNDMIQHFQHKFETERNKPQDQYDFVQAWDFQRVIKRIQGRIESVKNATDKLDRLEILWDGV